MLPMWLLSAIWLWGAWQVRAIEPRAAVFMVFVAGWMLGFESLRLIQRIRDGR